MDAKIKKVIAREGLILLAIILLGFIFLLSADWLMNKDNPILKYLPQDHWTIEIVWANMVSNIGIYLIFLGYPIYLLIRFIIWAIRTLREK